jgi:hypothetical protein
MPCLVCGNPTTVKSHLTPRAFTLDIRGADARAYEGSLAFEGTRYTQAGTFDRTILCDAHEQALRDCDDYAIDWVRGMPTEARASHEDMLLHMPNPRPDLLLKFVCSHIWRHAVSPQNNAYDMDLGPWEGRLRQLIFNWGSGYNPTFHIIRQRWTSGEVELKELIIPPFRLPGQGRRRWEFDLGGLIWVLRLNDRHVDYRLESFKANDADPVPILVVKDRELVDRPGALDIGVNMFREYYLREQREAGNL